MHQIPTFEEKYNKKIKNNQLLWSTHPIPMEYPCRTQLSHTVYDMPRMYTAYPVRVPPPGKYPIRIQQHFWSTCAYMLQLSSILQYWWPNCMDPPMALLYEIQLYIRICISCLHHFLLKNVFMIRLISCFIFLCNLCGVE